MIVVRLGRLKFLISFKNPLKDFKSFGKHQSSWELQIVRNTNNSFSTFFESRWTGNEWAFLNLDLITHLNFDSLCVLNSWDKVKEKRRRNSLRKKVTYLLFLYQKRIKYIFLFFRYIECTLFLVLQINNWYSSFLNFKLIN